ncbi:unnamed protein product, partial [Meganyctiphanes norvegica]
NRMKIPLEEIPLSVQSVSIDLSPNNESKFLIPDIDDQKLLELSVEQDDVEKCLLYLRWEGAQTENLLHIAAKKGSINVFACLLSYGIDVNTVNKKGKTPLHYAAQSKDEKILEMIIDKGGKLDIDDKYGRIPLHNAAISGSKISCELLVQNDSTKTHANKKDKTGKTPLIMAAEAGYFHCCRVMENANLNMQDNVGKSALYCACEKGQLKTIIWLLKHEANIELADKKGYTPIIAAARGGHKKCLETLHTKGANIMHISKTNKNILHYAAENKSEACLEYCINIEELRKSENINKKDKFRNTPIMYALQKEAEKCVLMLLDAGASKVMGISAAKGESPLHLAAKQGFFSVCRTLLEDSDLRIDQRNHDGNTALHFAAKFGSAGLCKLLLDKKASYDIRNKNGEIPLHVAAKHNQISSLRCLSAAHRQMLRHRDNNGNTALHIVAASGKTDGCKVIVSYNLKTLIDTDKKGRYPFQVAYNKGHFEIFRFLLRNIQIKTLSDSHKKVLNTTIHRYMHEALKTADEDESGHIVSNIEVEDEEDETNDKQMLLKNKTDSKEVPKIEMKKNKKNQRIIAEAVIHTDWWEEAFNDHDCKQCDNFKNLVEQHKDLAFIVQEKCIREGQTSIEYDFRIYEGIAPSEDDWYSIDGWRNKHPLYVMMKQKMDSLLMHRLSRMWLLRKWKNYMRYIYFTLLAIQVIYVISLSLILIFAWTWDHLKRNCNITMEQFCTLVKDIHPHHLESQVVLFDENATILDILYSKVSSNITSSLGDVNNSTFMTETEVTVNGNSTEEEFGGLDGINAHSFLNCTEHFREHIAFRHGLLGCLVLIFIIKGLLEVNSIIRLRQHYFNSVDHAFNWAQTVLAIPLIIPTNVCSGQMMVLDPLAWTSGIMALLLAWIFLINTFNSIPVMSAFMPVSRMFMANFLKLLFYFGMWISVFALIFYLILFDHPAFSTWPQAAIKTVVWMLGDLGYDDVFIETFPYYRIISNIFFLLFLMTMAIFISNLAVNTSSDAIEEFRNRAKAHHVSNCVRLFFYYDICFPWFKRRFILDVYEFSMKNDPTGADSKSAWLLVDTEKKKATETETLQKEVEELKGMVKLLLDRQNIDITPFT